MTALEKLRDALVSIEGLHGHVWHCYAHDRTPPYLIWMEDSAGNTVAGDGAICHQAIEGTADLYTADLDDWSLFHAVQLALNQNACAWRLNSVQYEDDTKLKHYEWVWQVVNDGELCG